MILYPAIDLKDGVCVRLVRGEMSQATVFNVEPADQARVFDQQGFSWLHLVDLNGAFEGYPVNQAAVERVLAAVAMPLTRPPPRPPGTHAAARRRRRRCRAGAGRPARGAPQPAAFHIGRRGF